MFPGKSRFLARHSATVEPTYRNQHKTSAEEQSDPACPLGHADLKGCTYRIDECSCNVRRWHICYMKIRSGHVSPADHDLAPSVVRISLGTFKHGPTTISHRDDSKATSKHIIAIAIINSAQLMKHRLGSLVCHARERHPCFLLSAGSHLTIEGPVCCCVLTLVNSLFPGS